MSSRPELRSAIDVARDYTRRGWRVIPVPHRDKKITLKGWKKLRRTEAELPRYFTNPPQNVGVLLGEPSGWVIDVDLDIPEAAALARDYLPPTEAVFGRAGNRGSHYLYRTTSPLETLVLATTNRKKLVEIRSTGCQTVFPGSTHETGERIEWEAEGDPAEVDPVELLEAATRLARDAAAEKGWKLALDIKRPPRQTRLDPPPPPSPAVADSYTRCVVYLRTLPDAVSGEGGHDATLRAACECFRFGLSRDEARHVMEWWSAEKSRPAS